MKSETVTLNDMKKELKDYLHLYLGCEILNADGKRKLIAVMSDELDGQFVVENKYGEQETLTSAIFNKPILRRLDSMTEEEQNDLRRIMKTKAPENLLPPIKVSPILELWVHKDSPEIIRYLLSKSFDLFGLIDAGLAIDATTLPNDLNKK